MASTLCICIPTLRLSNLFFVIRGDGGETRRARTRISLQTVVTNNPYDIKFSSIFTLLKGVQGSSLFNNCLRLPMWQLIYLMSHTEQHSPFSQCTQDPDIKQLFMNNALNAVYLSRMVRPGHFPRLSHLCSFP